MHSLNILSEFQTPALTSIGNTKPDIVVAIRRVVVVAIGYPAIVVIVIPRTAPQNPISFLFDTLYKANLYFFLPFEKQYTSRICSTIFRQLPELKYPK